MFAKIQAQILLLNDDLTTLIPCDELYLRLRWADFDEILAGSPVFIGDWITRSWLKESDFLNRKWALQHRVIVKSDFRAWWDKSCSSKAIFWRTLKILEDNDPISSSHTNLDPFYFPCM